MQSSTGTSSASVELLVFNFCFLDKVVIEPLPIVIDIPVWHFMSGCTAWAASMLHLVSPVPSRDRAKHSVLVLHRKFIIRWNLNQSCVVGSLTLVHRNATTNRMSGLDLKVRNKALATNCMERF